jgi:hypothetical protein
MYYSATEEKIMEKEGKIFKPEKSGLSAKNKCTK